MIDLLDLRRPLDDLLPVARVLGDGAELEVDCLQAGELLDVLEVCEVRELVVREPQLFQLGEAIEVLELLDLVEGEV